MSAPLRVAHEPTTVVVIAAPRANPIARLLQHRRAPSPIASPLPGIVVVAALRTEPIASPELLDQCAASVTFRKTAKQVLGQVHGLATRALPPALRRSINFRRWRPLPLATPAPLATRWGIRRRHLTGHMSHQASCSSLPQGLSRKNAAHFDASHFAPAQVTKETQFARTRNQSRTLIATSFQQGQFPLARNIFHLEVELFQTVTVLLPPPNASHCACN